MLKARDFSEKNIWWETRCGNASFWHDNWTGFGSLTSILHPNDLTDLHIYEVSELMSNGQ